MSLNKICNQQNTGSERWMHITCKDILADELKGDQVIANSVTAVVTTSDIINSDDVINANQIKCQTLEVEDSILDVPQRKYYTNWMVGISLADPETDILINGTGDLSYNGDDRLGSETKISSQASATFNTGDQIKFKVYRGGKLLSEFDYAIITGSNGDKVSLDWTITTRQEGENGSLIVQVRLIRGKSTGTPIDNNLYKFEELLDDITASGDLRVTMEPIAFDPASAFTVLQSTVTRTK